MKTLRVASVLLLSILLIAEVVYGGSSRNTSKTFDKKERIKISTVSGDCIVQRGESDRITVEVDNSYRPRDSFEPRFKETSSTLKISERLFGSNSGSSTWILTVPDGIEIEFSTASGDFMVSELECEISVSTASGDIELDNCRGEFDISTASGDIEVSGCSGEFDLSTASGNIDVDRVLLAEESSFSTASGNVQVALGETPEQDISVSSASGRAILDFAGNPISGAIEMVAKKRGGRIRAPFECDIEEEFERWDDVYIRKLYNRFGDTPVIEISTASGRAELREG